MIRPVQLKDAQAIADICSSELGYEASAEDIADNLSEITFSEQYYMTVYEDEETQKVLGFIEAVRYILPYGSIGFNVIALAVSAEAKGRGIGRELLEELEETAYSSYESFIQVNCSVTRTDAHAFCEHMGYLPDKTQKRFIKKWIPND